VAVVAVVFMQVVAVELVVSEPQPHFQLDLLLL
jgi:hypothetical protein